ncbi:MAG: menaquinone biosynthesis protein [Flavobacteriales bacterium]|nr:menaquinone biosynthesis protein [Flavobacteriales bacterium]
MKYKLSVVSYLNTIPFIYGLQQSRLDKKLDISLDIPSVCAEKLMTNKVDVGLVPIVVLKQIQHAHIISDFCIGADGQVDTVCLFSDVPINEIESIYLDYQSKTSVELLKILLTEYWKISPKLLESNANYENQISGNTAGLIIGDRVFQHQHKFKYVYDLSAIWKKHTGLPFVFACWIANKEIDKDFQKEFNNALKFGITNIEKAIKSATDIYSHCKNPLDYLNNKISYILDAEKKKGMELFLRKVGG